MNQNINLIKKYFSEKIKIAKSIDNKQIDLIYRKMINTYEKNGNVYLMANGGPAGLIDNASADLRFHPFVQDDKSKEKKIKKRLKVISFIESSSSITGISNDKGFENIFSEQLKIFIQSKLVNKNDLLIAFSGSGNSKNVINAIILAKKYNIFTVCISGRSGGMAKKISDLCLLVPGSSSFPGQIGKNDNNFHIEDFQLTITHILTGLFCNYIDKKK